MRTISIGVVLLLLVGCGGEENPSNRLVCLLAGQAHCARAEECFYKENKDKPGQFGSIEGCVTRFMVTCCGDRGMCDEESRFTDEQMQACAQAFRSLSCQATAEERAAPVVCLL